MLRGVFAPCSFPAALGLLQTKELASRNLQVHALNKHGYALSTQTVHKVALQFLQINDLHAVSTPVLMSCFSLGLLFCTHFTQKYIGFDFFLS